jgi:hypothetical protein
VDFRFDVAAVIELNDQQNESNREGKKMAFWVVDPAGEG